jgi:hypothetical protein
MGKAGMAPFGARSSACRIHHARQAPGERHPPLMSPYHAHRPFYKNGLFLLLNQQYRGDEKWKDLKIEKLD